MKEIAFPNSDRSTTDTLIKTVAVLTSLYEPLCSYDSPTKLRIFFMMADQNGGGNTTSSAQMWMVHIKGGSHDQLPISIYSTCTLPAISIHNYRLRDMNITHSKTNFWWGRKESRSIWRNHNSPLLQSQHA